MQIRRGAKIAPLLILTSDFNLGEGDTAAIHVSNRREECRDIALRLTFAHKCSNSRDSEALRNRYLCNS